MNYSALKAAIAQVVRPNDNQEITGENLQGVFNALVNSIAQGYLFAGVATPSTEPGTPDQNVVYLAGAGSYSNFGASITVNSGCLGIFAFNGEWTKDIVQIGGSIQGIPSVDIAQLNSLGTPTDQAYINPSVYTVTTLHNLSSTVIKVGTLFVFSDAGRSVVTQILLSNYQVDGGGNISSPNASKITIYYRMYNISQSSWNAWTLYGGGGGVGTIDPYPISGSDNAVASNGAFEGLQKAAPEVNINDLDDLGNSTDMRTGEASVYTLKYMHIQSSTWLRIGVVMCFANHAQNTLTQIVFSNCVVDGGGNLIPNYATNVMNIYYRFKQFSGNPPEGMTIGVWSAWTKFEGGGDSGYQPNNEDIDLNASDKLQFADKSYDASAFSGLGRVYLRKNIVELNLTDKYFDGFVSDVLVQDEGTSSTPDVICFDTTRKMFVARVGLLWYLDWSSDEEYNPITRDVNWNYNGNFYRWNGEELAQWDKTINQLTQAMVNTANTAYIIQYDYDLNDQTITLPAGCVLEFEGGRLSFGSIVFDETYIAGSDYLCLYSVTLSGTIKNTELNADCVYANDIGIAINNLFNVVDVVKLSKRKYLQKTTILFNKNNKKLIGLNYDKVIEAGGYQQAATEVSCDVDINSVYITSNRCLVKGIRFITINTNTHAGLLTSAALFGEIRNCEFTYYAVGIHLQGGFNFLVSDCLITNSVFGIALTGGGSQINGVVVTNNYIKSVYCAIYINNSNNLSFYHNTFEIVHADYKDRTITYITFNYPKSAAIIEYLSKNSAFRDTYIEGCNCVFNTDNNSRCTLIDNMYYNSHIGETYVKAFTQNFFGYVKNITIKNVYFAKRVNETASLGTKTNGVIYANENVYIEGCQLSYIIVNNVNVNIGTNLFETTRFGGIVFMDAANIKSVVSSWGTSYSGTTTNRPTVTDMPKGFPYFDTTLGKPIWWNGSAWIDATGAAV